jgi:hypothetical protein
MKRGTPQEELLKQLYKEHKGDLDGGWLEVSTKFAEVCFNEIKALGDKAKVADIHKYIAAMHHVTVNRMEEQFKKHMAMVSKLH